MNLNVLKRWFYPPSSSYNITQLALCWQDSAVPQLRPSYTVTSAYKRMQMLPFALDKSFTKQGFVV